MGQLVRQLLIGLVVVAVQWLVLGRLDLWGVFPDVVVLYIAFVALQSGRRAGSVFGFVLGFFMDWLYGTWGVHMLIKTIVGFLIGLFPVDERAMRQVTPVQAFVGGLVIALLHNGLAVIFYALTAGTRTGFLIFGLWLGGAVYTAFIGMITAFFVR